jgi:hypothetical protein
MKWQTYLNKEPKTQPPRFISQREALECIGRTHEELNQAGPWPEFLTAWLEKNHNEAFQAIRRADRKLDYACEKHLDDKELEKALTEYKHAWLEGLTRWKIEQQPSIQVGHRRLST